MSGETGWVRTFEDGADYIESLDGVCWADAPLPYPWHRCEPQTRGWLGLNCSERCACGATRLDGRGPWMEKNQTRRDRARRRRNERAPKETVTCGICDKPYEAVAGSLQARERVCTSCWADLLRL
jgi:hypothetical protein